MTSRLPDGGRPRPRASGLVGVGFGALRRPPRLTRTMTRPAVSFRGMVRSRALRSTGRADGPSAADRFLLETDPAGPQRAPSGYNRAVPDWGGVREIATGLPGGEESRAYR